MRRPGRRSRYTKRLIGLALALTSLIIWTGLQTPGLVSSASRVQFGSKEEMVARLSDLDSTIATLKQQVASDPKGEALKAQLDKAMAEYDRLSEAMGGDRAPVTANAGLAPKAGGRIQAPTGGIGVVPPAPGCTITTTVTTNSTPVAIPTGPAVVTSTLMVAGANPYLWDVNLRTFITHTFAADLDITLTSPAGTVVTLTTDNGAGNDDVFNGTVWDDSANPAGQVPYLSNNGLVTDHVYVNLTLASPLVPEEAMAAFNGENPNGTWTITISDDAVGDGGSLNSWDLEISTLPAAPTETTTSFNNTTPVAIPTGPAVVTSTLAVAGAGTLTSKVTLLTNITHTFAADLDITIMSPAGTVVTLTTDNGSGNENVFAGTLWDDKANPGGQVPYTFNNGLVTDQAYVNLTLASPLVPEEALGAFIGEDPNGTWTITISDDSAGDGGALNNWTLNVTTATCAAACTGITCPANVTQSNDPNQCGAVVNYPAPTSTGTCGTITCTPPSGSFFAVGTTTVTCSSSIAQSVTTVYSSGNIAVPIPDNNPNGVSVPINVPDTGPVTDVNVRIRLDHTFDSNLAIGLSHSNSGNALSLNNGGSGDNYGTGANDCSGTKTVFDDAAATLISAGTAPFAGTFKPQSGLTIHNGSPNDGLWTLTVVDQVASDTGTIGCFELETTRQVSPMCSFTVTVNDTQPPVITCPPNQTAVTPVATDPCTVVNFTTTASDNCPGVVVVCNPPSGSCFPVGVTTVTCTATDASGNTATCSFTISVFNGRLQDDSEGCNNTVLFNTITGDYRWCCHGTIFTGLGKVTIAGDTITIIHNAVDRRVLIRLSAGSFPPAGTASLQSPAGTIRCVITDRDTRNDTCVCGAPPPPKAN